jgi:anti-anti-sigma regulatory factor
VPRKSAPQRAAITLTDESGAERLDAFRRALTDALASGDAPITVDLSETVMLDSALLAVLLVAATSAAATGRPLSVLVGPRLHHDLTEWRFDTVLSISEAHPAP